MSQEDVNTLFRDFRLVYEPSKLKIVFDKAERLNAEDKKSFALKLQKNISEQSIADIANQPDFRLKMSSLGLMSVAEREQLKFKMNSDFNGMGPIIAQIDRAAAFVTSVLGQETNQTLKSYISAVSELPEGASGTSFGFILACTQAQESAKPQNTFKPSVGPTP